MSVHVACSCGARLAASERMLGKRILCPACGSAVDVPEVAPLSAEKPPAAVAAASPAIAETAPTFRAETVRPEPHAPRADAGTQPDPAAATTWRPAASVARATAAAPQRRRWWILLLLLVPVLAVAALIVVPLLTFNPSEPERVVAAYLAALQAHDYEAADGMAAFGIADHPRVGGWEHVEEDEAHRHPPLAGNYAELSRVHQEMQQDFVWNEETGRFQVSSELRQGLRVLDRLHEAREQQMQFQLPNDITDIINDDETFNALIAPYEAIAVLAEEELAPENLAPTYAMLLAESHVELSPAQRELAELFAEDPERWAGLLGRPFVEISSGGDFRLDRATVTARVYGEVSPGQGGRLLVFHLRRFQLGAIDTGWQIWSWEERRPGEAPPESSE